MQRIITLLLLASLTGAVFFTRSLAGSSAPCHQPVLSVHNAIGWTKDPLNGDDAPFKQIRTEIDAQIAKSKDKTALAQTYKNAALKTPKDAKVQFRWAYAAYLASNHWQVNVRKTHALCGIYAAMGIPENPQSFEYTRLRFFIGRLDSIYSGRKEMNELGIRLLDKASKEDFDLRFFGINALGAIINTKDQKVLHRCLNLTLDLQKDYPQRVEPISMLGDVYSANFTITKEPIAADKAFQYYHQYLSKAPESYHYGRWIVQDKIRILRDVKDNYQKHGELKP